MSKQTTAIAHVDHIIEIFDRKGLQHAVVSPGSRNAPIVIALEARANIQKHVVVDERSAGFIALGIAQQTQQPVILVCTSGSALLNYAPAISEAFYRNLPLIVISADRPSAWTDQGDGQTIRQMGALEPHVVKTIAIEPSRDDHFWHVNRCANEAWNSAVTSSAPIHINLPLDEPLYNVVEYPHFNDVRLFETVATHSDLHPDSLQQLKEQWDQASRKMILIGQHTVDHQLNKIIQSFAEFPDVCILTENLSNVQHPKINSCIDRSLAGIGVDKAEDFQPDLLITLGGPVVSKRIKKFLRNSPILHHWKIGQHFPTQDTYCHLTESIPISENQFLQTFLAAVEPNTTNRYGLQWKQLDYLNEEKHNQFLGEATYSDLTVFQTLLDFLPDNSVLHLGNSSVVRYAQLFNPIQSLTYYGNRGTSGIDGSTSTAVGAAMVDQEKCHTIITGDLSFFYDSNALWNDCLSENLRIILINNSGGDIFKIIDGPSKTKAFEKYFHVTHDQKAQKLCEAFDIHYMQAHDLASIEDQMIDFFAIKDDHRPVLLEINTPSEVNAKILKDYFKSLNA